MATQSHPPLRQRHRAPVPTSEMVTSYKVMYPRGCTMSQAFPRKAALWKRGEWSQEIRTDHQQCLPQAAIQGSLLPRLLSWAPVFKSVLFLGSFLYLAGGFSE